MQVGASHDTGDGDSNGECDHYGGAGEDVIYLRAASSYARCQAELKFSSTNPLKRRL